MKINEGYIKEKLIEARNHINFKYGDKRMYFYKDVLSCFNEYGKCFESDLLSVSRYIPQKGNDTTSIKKFTKGFIDNENSKIIVLLLDKGFEVFVISLDKSIFLNFYSLNINNFTLKLSFYLEVMKPNFKF